MDLLEEAESTDKVIPKLFIYSLVVILKGLTLPKKWNKALRLLLPSPFPLENLGISERSLGGLCLPRMRGKVTQDLVGLVSKNFINYCNSREKGETLFKAYFSFLT